MSEVLTKGWLPIDIEFDPVPSVITEAPVRWMEFGSEALEEPFFSQTVARLRQAMRPPAELDMSIETTIRIASLLPAVQPAGFIFHVSHCGSTLLSNALKTVPNSVVASESIPLGRLARRYPEAPGKYLKARWEETRRRLLEAMFKLLAHYRTGAPEKLVVKFASFNLLAIQEVRKHWPATPCVILVREPVEVLASALGEKGWLAVKDDPEAARVLFGLGDVREPLETMSNEEYCARVLGRHLESAVESVDENCKVVDYENLSPGRIREIGMFFGVELPAEKRDLDRILAVYSKDPARIRPFEPDTFRKQRPASREAREAAQEWARPAYSALRARGYW
jgi:hypothetical protein